MAPNIPPETKNKYLGLAVDVFKTELGLFAQALQAEHKEIDVYASFGIKKPEEVDVASLNAGRDAITQLEQIKNIVGVTMSRNGSFEETEAGKRIEQMAMARFSEQKSDILAINSDFPIAAIESLNLPYTTKVTMMGGLKNVARANADAIATIKKELDNAAAKDSTAKFGSDEQPLKNGERDPKDTSAADKIAKFSSQAGLQKKP